MSREVVVVSGVRTAIGTFGGSLKDIAPTDLAALVVRESLARAQVEGKDVGHVVFGRGHARHERQPSVRLGPASHCVGQPSHFAGRL
jgi:acetyl-CoA acetyltransferase